MSTAILYVKMSEENDGIIGSLTGTGLSVGFDGDEYNDDGTVTAEYSIEFYDAADLKMVERRLDRNSEVISYTIDA